MQKSKVKSQNIKIRGFTLIELIIVFSVTAILSMIGIASFVAFSRSQNMTNGILDLKTLLETARSNALSQVKPTVCGAQQLQGFQVNVCCSGGCFANCANTSGANYEMNVVCGGSTYNLPVYNKTLPVGVVVDPSSTTYSFYFSALSANVGGSGRVVLKSTSPIAGFTQTRIASVSATGIIQ